MRLVFLVDGFNLYHSVKDADKDIGSCCSKWLEIKSMCSSFISSIGQKAILEKIYYFTAFAYHKDLESVGNVARHKHYIRALKATGIVPVEGKFQKTGKRIVGSSGKWKYQREEKMTDVAIASKLLEILFINEAEGVVLVSGDTDFVPAVETAKRLFPERAVFILFPYKRKNDELAKVADGSFKLKMNSYRNNIFPDIVCDKRKRDIVIPVEWEN